MPAPRPPRGRHGPRLLALVAVVLLAACSSGGSGGSDPVDGAPRDAGPRVVVMIGDSLTFDGYDAFHRALSAGSTRAVVEGRPGSGLLDAGPIPYDWLPRLDALLLEHEPTDVVVEFVGNYDRPLARDAAGREIAPSSPEMYAAWRAAMEDVVERVARSGARLHWVLPPPTATGDAALDGRYAEIRRLHATEIPGRWPDVELIDWAPALTDADGRYALVLPGPSGAPEQVRDEDGLHLTKAGAQRAAEATARALGLG